MRLSQFSDLTDSMQLIKNTIKNEIHLSIKAMIYDNTIFYFYYVILCMRYRNQSTPKRIIILRSYLFYNISTVFYLRDTHVKIVPFSNRLQGRCIHVDLGVTTAVDASVLCRYMACYILHRCVFFIVLNCFFLFSDDKKEVFGMRKHFLYTIGIAINPLYLPATIIDHWEYNISNYQDLKKKT
ncbi:hypothetical protein AGLY_014767 [Aphis glycines]|uniref:Uncharacterized protein n=1 Tax=Aphis glycines TaxID=307491 RepID=A0A6G0T488_APHGL|nr:hypothetical protein AGLY_014767 [Aphis glycines]